MANETDARIIIDRLLREADWDIEDKAQVSTEEAAADGRADYVLKDSRSRPLAVIEAKRFSSDPYAAKDQARAYAQSLPGHFVILSNGHDHLMTIWRSGRAHCSMAVNTVLKDRSCAAHWTRLPDSPAQIGARYLCHYYRPSVNNGASPPT